MTESRSNAERLRKLYQAFEIGGDEAAAKLIGDIFDPDVEFNAVGDDLVIVFTRLVGTARDTSLPLRQDLSLVYEFAGGLVRCVTAYESPAEALEAAERGHADA